MNLGMEMEFKVMNFYVQVFYSVSLYLTIHQNNTPMQQ